MGNIHRAIQVLPTYYKGVAIEVKEACRHSFPGMFNC